MELYLCTDAFGELEDVSSLEEINGISITPPTEVNAVGLWFVLWDLHAMSSYSDSSTAQVYI